MKNVKGLGFFVKKYTVFSNVVLLNPTHYHWAENIDYFCRVNGIHTSILVTLSFNVVKVCLLPYSSDKELIGILKGRELRYSMK